MSARGVALGLLIALLGCSTARAQASGQFGLPLAPLAIGQSEVLLGDGASWKPVWGVPLYVTLWSRPLFTPSKTDNAYVALQPVTRGCADSPTADHASSLLIAPDVYADAYQSDGTYEYQFAAHPTLSVASSVQACIWFAHSPHEQVFPVSQVLPLINGAQGATITSLGSPPGWWGIDFFSLGFGEGALAPPISITGTYDECGDSLSLDVGPTLGGSESSDGQCSDGSIDYDLTATFSFGGVGGNTLSYDAALGTAMPPAVEHLGDCIFAPALPVAEAVYYLEKQGCTVDRLLPDGEAASGPATTVDTLIDGGEATVFPVGTHVDLEVTGTGAPDGSAPPVVSGVSAVPAPAGADCNDLATFAPGFASKEKELFELESLSSEDAPIAVTLSISLGSVGICSREVDDLSPSLAAKPSPELDLAFEFPVKGQTENRIGSFTFLPFGWHVPPGDGGRTPAPAAINWPDASLNINAVPSLSFSYTPGESPDVEVTLMSVPIAQTTATLVDAGQPFLNATVGPELDLGLKLNRTELEELEAQALALGLDAVAANEYVVNAIADQLASALNRLVVEITPPSSESIEGYEPDLTDVDTEVDSDITATDEAAEAAAAAAATEEEAEAEAVESDVIESLFDEADTLGGDFVEDLPEAVAAAAADHRPPAGTSAAPPGLVAGHGGLFAPSKLVVSPLRRLKADQLLRAPFPRAEIGSAASAALALPDAARVGALAVTSKRLIPREHLSFVAVGFGAGSQIAELVLAGPDFRATHLLKVVDGAAAATVTLPSRLAAGRWTLAVEDLSGVTAGADNALAGTALVRMGIFTVH